MLINEEYNQGFASRRIKGSQITLVSGHWPLDVYFARQTRSSIETYAKQHGYGLFYSEQPPQDSSVRGLHYERCNILQKAGEMFPDSTWFVWLDTDVFVHRTDLRIESQLDLEDDRFLYHLFHEQPREYPINTGVKFVHRDALVHEKALYEIKNSPPWNEWPYEQKAMVEYLLPRIPGRYSINDPRVLNRIVFDHPFDLNDSIFLHLCGTPTLTRNIIMFLRKHGITSPFVYLFLHVIKRIFRKSLSILKGSR